MASFENANYICTCYAKKCDRNCRTYRRFTHTESNADRIRAMTDEELAKFVTMVHGNGLLGTGPTNGWLDWLRQEATDG